MLDTRGDEFDAVGIRTIKALELVRFGDAGRGDHVRATHDVGLGRDPASGLVVPVFRLDACEGVKGGHQGELELVLEPVCRHAGQPVVGVQDVGAAGAFEVGCHPIGELVDDAVQRFFVELGRAGGHVHDAHTRFDRHLDGEIVGPLSLDYFDTLDGITADTPTIEPIEEWITHAPAKNAAGQWV